MKVSVASAVGHALAALGVKQAFGVVGSGNFHFTNGMLAAGIKFVAARHEGGAATMADAYARMCDEVAVLSVHQGCGLTNAITGIGEAAKSRTPLLVVTGEVRDPSSNFYMDQDALAHSVGAQVLRVRSAATALKDVRKAYDLALNGRQTVVLNLPLDVQDDLIALQAAQTLEPVVRRPLPQAAQSEIEQLCALLKTAKRPVFIAGRGSRSDAAGAALVQLASQVGALLAEGAVAKGLFADQPWSVNVAGGFSSPETKKLIAEADVVVGWGCALNMWTTAHGTLLGPDVKLVQVDLEPQALGKHWALVQGVLGDVGATAARAAQLLAAEGYSAQGYRTPEVAQRIAGHVLWRTEPYADNSTATCIDPRTLSVALQDMLPARKVVGVDSGNFMGYPSMYLQVPDQRSFAFTQAFQSIGLGLSTAIGAALAQPDKFPVAACGDGGFLMGISELETAVRLQLGMLIVVYNDNAYGAEVYYFGDDGHPVDAVVFPETDIAAIARGYGAEGLTVRTPADLQALAARLAQGLDKPLVVDAKVTGESAWWHRAAMSHH